MKTVVCIKQVATISDDIEFNDDGRSVDEDYVDFAMNEFDTYALEEALRLRDTSGSGEVVVVTVGDARADEILHRALAMGADRAVRVWSDELAEADPVRVARALASVVGPEAPDLVLCGVQSSDSVNGATGTALAGVLDLPCVAVVTKVEPEPGGALLVHRELEGGLIDVVEVDFPALLSVQSGINEPRYVSMRAMMAAASAPVQQFVPGELGRAGHAVVAMAVPERKRAEMLGESPDEVAQRIAGLVAEALGR